MSVAKNLGKNFDRFLFVGSYTKQIPWATGNGRGISIFKFDEKTVNLDLVDIIPKEKTGINPSSFVLNKNTNHLYICNEYCANKRVS